jgi:hypothetical protein
MFTILLYLLYLLGTSDWGGNIISVIFMWLNIAGFLDPILVILISILTVSAVLADSVMIAEILRRIMNFGRIENFGRIVALLIAIVSSFFFYYYSPDETSSDRLWRNEIREFVLNTKTIDGEDMGVSEMFSNVLHHGIGFPEDKRDISPKWYNYNIVCVKLSENWFIKERMSYFPTAEQSLLGRLARGIGTLHSLCTEWYSIPLTLLAWRCVWVPISWILLNISPGIFIFCSYCYIDE